MKKRLFRIIGIAIVLALLFIPIIGNLPVLAAPTDLYFVGGNVTPGISYDADQTYESPPASGLYSESPDSWRYRPLPILI